MAEAETSFDDDSYRQAVAYRYQWLYEQVTVPDHSSGICMGEGFALRHLDQSLSAELSERPQDQGIYAADEIWPCTLEAYTRLVTTSQSGTAHRAVIHVERVLDIPHPTRMSLEFGTS